MAEEVLVVEAKRGRGRPRKEIDVRLIQMYASSLMTPRMIAARLTFYGYDITEETLVANYSDIIKTAREYGCGTLLHAQLRAAMAGSAVMLIWLGKQYLHQFEIPDLKPDEVEKVVRGLLIRPNGTSANTAPNIPPKDGSAPN